MLGDPRRDGLLTLAVVLVVAATRLLALPASIWDQDEAVFAAAVLRFDPAHAQPHPPFFPLWIGLGGAVHRIASSLSPERALQLLSLGFSTWIVYPLTGFWSLVLPRRQALVAALLFLFLPLPWLLSGRAYTEPAATALLLAGAACWLPANASVGRRVVGAVALAACALVRPHWALLVCAVVVWRLAAGPRRGVLSVIVSSIGVIWAGVLGWVAWVVGGWESLSEIVRWHAAYQWTGLVEIDIPWGDLAILTGVGGWVSGGVWVLLAASGAYFLLRQPTTRASTAAMIATLLAPMLLILHLLHNPTLPRYALLYLALSAGLVVAAMSRLCRRRTAVALAAVAMGLLAARTGPLLAAYRNEPAPAVRAMNRVARIASRERVHLVADPSLVSFVRLWEEADRWPAGMSHDFELLPGRRAGAPGARMVAAWDTERTRWRATAGECVVLACGEPRLCALASPRFGRVTVCVLDPEEEETAPPGSAGP